MEDTLTEKVAYLKNEYDAQRAEIALLSNELQVLSKTLQSGISEIRDIVSQRILDEPMLREPDDEMRRVNIISVCIIGALTAIGIGITMNVFTHTSDTSTK